MRKEHITLTRTELNKLDVIQRSLRGALTVDTTATVLDLSQR